MCLLTFFLFVFKLVIVIICIKNKHHHLSDRALYLFMYFEYVFQILVFEILPSTVPLFVVYNTHLSRSGDGCTSR